MLGGAITTLGCDSLMGHNHFVSVHVNILESWWHCCGVHIHVIHISGGVHLAVHTQFVGVSERRANGTVCALCHW